ncbi:MAG: sulfatase-like hydrolase/transferase, partial [bacterium]|nr:sulfatase-like hydrolase/transferase [bacterium]
MADAAVGEVFAALRDAGLWDDSLVMVTSDHGEAFMEHGRVGHNSTIYEEMLRVPLIVKLPAGRSAQGIDTGSLRSLGDLAPTILGLVGLEPPSEVRFPDLLAPGRPAEAERAVFLRSSQPERTIFGVRTPRWKAITREGGTTELYDLVADPRESTDLAPERPLLHAGLILLLEQAMNAPSPLRAGEREEEISQDDQRMLRALGYI